MDLHERKCWDCGNVAVHEDRITPWVLCSKCGSQDTRPTKRPPPTREQQLRTTVAELVALLRMGKELAEAARDSTQGTPEKRYRASREANAILEQYDAAIAEYGGA